MGAACCKKYARVGKTKSSFREFNVSEFDPSNNSRRADHKIDDIRFNPSQLQEYPLNISETTKYNLFTFLPKALMFQFKKYTNIYFGLLLIPACFNVVAAYGLESELPPFIFIILIALIREAIEDIRRHKSDR